MYTPPLARKLRELRKAAGESQETIAAYLGVGQQAYSKYETGTTEIPIRKLIKFCTRVNVPLDVFLPLYREPVTLEPDMEEVPSHV